MIDENKTIIGTEKKSILVHVDHCTRKIKNGSNHFPPISQSRINSDQYFQRMQNLTNATKQITKSKPLKNIFPPKSKQNNMTDFSMHSPPKPDPDLSNKYHAKDSSAQVTAIQNEIFNQLQPGDKSLSLKLVEPFIEPTCVEINDEKSEPTQRNPFIACFTEPLREGDNLRVPKKCLGEAPNETNKNEISSRESGSSEISSDDDSSGSRSGSSETSSDDNTSGSSNGNRGSFYGNNKDEGVIAKAGLNRFQQYIGSISNEGARDLSPHNSKWCLSVDPLQIPVKKENKLMRYTTIERRPLKSQTDTTSFDDNTSPNRTPTSFKKREYRPNRLFEQIINDVDRIISTESLPTNNKGQNCNEDREPSPDKLNSNVIEDLRDNPGIISSKSKYIDITKKKHRSRNECKRMKKKTQEKYSVEQDSKHSVAPSEIRIVPKTKPHLIFPRPHSPIPVKSSILRTGTMGEETPYFKEDKLIKPERIIDQRSEPSAEKGRNSSNVKSVLADGEEILEHREDFWEEDYRDIDDIFSYIQRGVVYYASAFMNCRLNDCLLAESFSNSIQKPVSPDNHKISSSHPFHGIGLIFRNEKINNRKEFHKKSNCKHEDMKQVSWDYNVEVVELDAESSISGLNNIGNIVIKTQDTIGQNRTTTKESKIPQCTGCNNYRHTNGFTNETNCASSEKINKLKGLEIRKEKMSTYSKSDIPYYAYSDPGVGNKIIMDAFMDLC